MARKEGEAASFVKMDDDGMAAAEEDRECCFGGKLTANSKVLLVSMAFFSTITVAQAFAALAANSNALLVDCVSMGLDAASYGCNVISEAWPSPDKRVQERNQLITAGISFALLIAFTLSFMLEALDTIQNESGDDDSCCDFGGDARTEEESCHVAHSACENITKAFRDDFTSNENLCLDTLSEDGANKCVWEGVNPYIVFAFALFGLLFDLGSLMAFKKWGSSFSVLVGGEDSEALNMSSALMHVLSDCLRSTTTLIESILIFFNPSTPSYIFDGWATLIVTASILLGALNAVYKWVIQLREWVRAGSAGAAAPLTQGYPATGGSVQSGYTPPVAEPAA
jgi:Co/Zn/Cd efflux system component